MRTLSDKKARTAFKAHKNAEGAELAQFASTWKSYIKEWDLHFYTRY